MLHKPPPRPPKFHDGPLGPTQMLLFPSAPSAATTEKKKHRPPPDSPPKPLTIPAMLCATEQDEALSE